MLECHRISGTYYAINKNNDVIPKIKGGDFVYKDADERFNCVTSSFKHPIPTDNGGKSANLLKLIQNNQNIVGTHSLYKLLSQDVYRELKSRNYHLILDETLNTVEKWDGGGFSRVQIKDMWDRGIIYQDNNTGRVRWEERTAHKLPEETILPSVKRLVDNGNLLTYKDTNIILWIFPIDFLTCFDSVTILTYNWEGSIMQKYLNKFGVEQVITKQEDRDELERDMFSRIHILDNKKMNAIGSQTFYDLSHADTRKMCKDNNICTLKKNLINWFNNMNVGQTKDDRAVSTFKDCQHKLRGHGYSKSFLPLNLRAVDCYKHITTVAYCCNLFQDKSVRNYLEMSKEDEGRWSYNELLQWLCRFAIRDEDEINLYIPSKRMRELLIK